MEILLKIDLCIFNKNAYVCKLFQKLKWNNVIFVKLNIYLSLLNLCPIENHLMEISHKNFS